MIAFAACSKKSRVVECVADIDYGFESLSAKDQQRIRKAIANRPVEKGVVQRKPSSKPRKCHKSVPIVHAIDTDTSCASSLDERVGRLTDDEDVDEKASISMLRAAGSFVMSPRTRRRRRRRSPKRLASPSAGPRLDGRVVGLRDRRFIGTRLWRLLVSEALSAPRRRRRRATRTDVRPQLGDTTVDWPHAAFQMVNVISRSIGFSSVRRRRRDHEWRC